MILFFFLFDASYAVSHAGIDGDKDNIVTTKEQGADGYFGAGTGAGGGPEVGFSEQTLKASGTSAEVSRGQSGEPSGIGAVGTDPIGRVLQCLCAVITQRFVFFRSRQIPSGRTDALDVPVPVVGAVANCGLKAVKTTIDVHILRRIGMSLADIFVNAGYVGAVTVFF